MKSRIKLMKISLMTIILLVFLQVVSAGITNPIPGELELLKGESGRFKFQIQNNKQLDIITCTATLEGDSPLVIEFDEEDMVVEGNAIKNFYGSVSVPDDETRQEEGLPVVGYGLNTQSFCIECKGDATPEGGATTINIKTCNLPVNVNVVGVRTRENAKIIPRPSQMEIDITLVVMVVIAIGIGMLIMILWSLYKKKRFKGKI